MKTVFVVRADEDTEDKKHRKLILHFLEMSKRPTNASLIQCVGA
jgi:hypothetical protein